MNYLGIDHHRQYSHLTLMDEKGNILQSGNVINSRSELEAFLEGVKDCRAVIEAGRSSYTLVDMLTELGVDVRLAHPKEVKSIAKAKVKTDKRDSRILAHLLRTDLVPEVYQRSKENRETQKILRQRAFYVGAMTRVKNRIHAFVVQQREEIQQEAAREKNMFSERGQKMLLGLACPEPEKKMLGSLVKTVRHLEDRVRRRRRLDEASFGFGYTFVASMGNSITYKVAVGLGALGVFLLIWVNLAVGIIGSEDNSANGMYLYVLIVGLLGIIISRLKPKGMAITMFAVAVVQMLVPTIALLFWNTEVIIAGESFWGNTGVFGAFVLNAVFATLWLGSAMLFQRAARA